MNRQQRDQKFGLLLLTGQFLTIASILFIVSVDDLKTPASVSLKILGAGVCLIGVGVVFIFRRFRLQSIRQKLREQQLRTSDNEIGAALDSARVHRVPPAAMKGAAPANLPAHNGRDRRMDARSCVNHPTLLNSKDAGVAGVRVLDVSPTGVRVSVPFRLELNTEVEIRVNDTTVSGLVRNCVCKAGTEFHVGVEVTEAISDGNASFDQVLRRSRAGGPVGRRT
ncbi:MAG: PilZ domain-containing protein [Bryobacteraceae bacterium]|jgi:hypothetical protein